MIGLALLVAVSAAQEAPPWRGSLAVSGAFTQGNLDQLQLRLRGQLTVHGGSVSSRTQVTGYRLWQRPEGAPDYISLGDDFVANESVRVRLANPLELDGLTRFEYSQLNRLDLRVLAGVGAAWVPLRAADRELRLLLGGVFEYAQYPDDVFRIDVAHTEGRRTLARVAVMHDGHLTPEESPLSLGYTALFVVNPAQLNDVRVLLDGTFNVRAWGPLGVQIAATYTYSSVVLQDVDPHDLQLTVGITLTGVGSPKA